MKKAEDYTVIAVFKTFLLKGYQDKSRLPLPIGSKLHNVHDNFHGEMNCFIAFNLASNLKIIEGVLQQVVQVLNSVQLVLLCRNKSPLIYCNNGLQMFTGNQDQEL